jgi:hypothetical protein
LEKTVKIKLPLLKGSHLTHKSKISGVCDPGSQVTEHPEMYNSKHQGFLDQITVWEKIN